MGGGYMLGKYGSMARDFLKENYPERYAELSAEEIKKMFTDVNEKAKERMEQLTKELLEKDPIKDPNNFWETVQHKEQIKSQAEEILFDELIYISR